ncbi:tafazzin-like isoform X1 [Limulus polyphemus]|uniref:Tafazzin family protein n=1 Tax=Limulus polyphemus TaxID=6850 RepID=A0ABM1TSP0_LIMPO|nr:tafazzin-like isoform X1 [Limulus polyphemus]
MPLDLQWPFPDFNKPYRLWQMRSSLVVCAVGMWSKIMIGSDWFNNVKVYNREVLIKALDGRPQRTPLVTVSNHHSCVDDPILWGILDWHHLLNPKVMRWSAAAHDICFTRKWHASFFAHGKTFPLCRGEGVYQWAMDFCVNLANAGNWIHFFPEGKVNLMNKEFHRLKWGVGRLITESKNCPLVIPFWHIGMDEVLPNKKPYIPRIGKDITVLIGDPVNFKSVREKLKKEKQPAMVQRKLITDILQEELGRLKHQAEQLHYQTFCLR